MKFCIGICSVIFQGVKFRGNKSKNILAGSGAYAPWFTVVNDKPYEWVAAKIHLNHLGPIRVSRKIKSAVCLSAHLLFFFILAGKHDRFQIC
jgi:hypothetical protein